MESALDFARALIDRRNVALRVEPDIRVHVRIVITARDGQHVDSVVEVSALRTDDSAVPVREGLIGGYKYTKIVEVKVMKSFALTRFLLKKLGAHSQALLP